MPIETKEYADAPIIVLVFTDPFNSNDISEGFAAAAALADQGKHVHVISDLTGFSMNFGDMIVGMSQVASAGPGGPADSRTTHYLVGGHELVRLAAESGQQEQYGSLDIKYFATVDEAVATARRQL